MGSRLLCKSATVTSVEVPVFAHVGGPAAHTKLFVISKRAEVPVPSTAPVKTVGGGPTLSVPVQSKSMHRRAEFAVQSPIATCWVPCPDSAKVPVRLVGVAWTLGAPMATNSNSNGMIHKDFRVMEIPCRR